MPNNSTSAKLWSGKYRPKASSSSTISSEWNTANSRDSSQSPDTLYINSLFTCVEQDVEASTSNVNAGNRTSSSSCSDRDSVLCLPGRSSNSSESEFEDESYPRIPDFLKDLLGVPCCKVHPETEKLYCHTCSKPLCKECGIQQHEDHATRNLMEVVENAKAQAKEVLKEVTLGVSAFQEEHIAAELTREMIEHQSKQTEADVMLTTIKASAILETRQKELLASIQDAKREQIPELTSACGALKKKIDRLSFICDILTDAMELNPEDDHPLCLSVITDMGSAEIDESDEASPPLSPQEEDLCIAFCDVETNFQSIVAKFGESVDKKPGTIGDQRQQRARVGTNFYEDFHAGLWPITSILLPRDTTRTHTFPVIVRDYWNSEQPPTKIIGAGGDVLDNLCRPWGVACDQEGNIIVGDRSNNRIQVYRQDGSLVRRFGSVGTAPGQFQRPAGVAVDAWRRIIVADKDNHRVQIFTMDGKFLLAFGKKGVLCGQFNYPWDVAVNSECQIIVSDTRNHRIQLFTGEGIFLQKYGHETKASLWEHFDCPRGVAFDNGGNIVVTDFNNHKVVRINSNFEEAQAFRCETIDSSRPFRRPQGIVVDDAGNVIVADSKNHRIQIFNKDGHLKWKYGSYGKGESEMDRPAGVALCPDGRIAVVDFGNNRVLFI